MLEKLILITVIACLTITITLFLFILLKYYKEIKKIDKIQKDKLKEFELKNLQSIEKATIEVQEFIMRYK